MPDVPCCDECGATFPQSNGHLLLGRHKRLNPYGRCKLLAPAALIDPPPPAAQAEQVVEEPAPFDADQEGLDEQEEFDSTFELVKLIFGVLRLSLNDGAELLALLQNPKFSIADVTTPTMAAMRAYLDQLLADREDGWSELAFTVTPDEVRNLSQPISGTFSYRDMLVWLAELLADTSLQGHFAYEAKQQEQDGQRVINEPYTADVWIVLQELLRQRLVESGQSAAQVGRAAIAALQVYADKTLVAIKGQQAHPIRCTLLNVLFGKRIKNLDCVGYLPILTRPREVSKEVWRQVKLHVNSKCMRHLLEPLRLASFNGVELKGPDGSERMWYPRLLSFVGDDPEVHDHACIYSGGKLPCVACQCPGSQRGEIFVGHEPRTQQQQRQVYDEIIRLLNTPGKVAEGHKLAAAWGTHPVPMPYWGWQDGDTEAGNPYHIFYRDPMHDDDLGVWLYLVQTLPAFFKDNCSNHKEAVRVLNDGLQSMPRDFDFQLPHCGGEYFPDQSRVQAKEHRNVIQVFPHLVNGAAAVSDLPRPLKNKVVQLACRYTEYYQLKYRKNCSVDFTEQALQGLDAALEAFHVLFMELLAEHLPRHGSTNKYHGQAHLTDQVRRMGHPKHVSSQFYENGHVESKRHYRATSRRRTTFLAELVRRQRLVAFLGASDFSSSEATRRQTAYMKAYSSSKNQLARTGKAYSLKDLSAGASGGECTAAASLLLSTIPGVADLGGALQKLLDAEVQRASNIAAGAAQQLDAALGAAGGGRPLAELPLPRRQRIQADPPRDAIEVVNSGVVAAEVAWEQQLVLQPVKAAARFSGSPWFDCVRIKADNRPGGAVARLTLLFRCTDAAGQHRSLALVESLQATSEADLLTANSACERFAPGRGGQSQLVVDFESILCKEYVVPDLARQGWSHTSPFKWFRGPADVAGVELG